MLLEINNLCKDYSTGFLGNRKIHAVDDVSLYINEGEKGIGKDWNFGISKIKTDYVTIAHQDDVYKPNYLEEIVKNMRIRMFFY